LKEWNSGNTFDRINTIWGKKREREDYIFEKKGDYSIYPIDDMNVILTTDEDVLEGYKKKRRKGLIKNIDDDYELEILDKVSEEYNIKLHPRLYYVMWSR
jgi:Pyruvate/2-oxoacid:ferredoxin oxidoreductase gamma subunit